EAAEVGGRGQPGRPATHHHDIDRQPGVNGSGHASDSRKVSRRPGRGPGPTQSMLAGILAATILFVDCGPGNPLRILLALAFLLLALLDVLGLAFLLVGIAGLVTARHDESPWFGGRPAPVRVAPKLTVGLLKERVRVVTILLVQDAR